MKIDSSTYITQGKEPDLAKSGDSHSWRFGSRDEKFLFISCKRLLICCVFGLAADGVLTKIGIDQYSRPIIHSLVEF